MHTVAEALSAIAQFADCLPAKPTPLAAARQGVLAQSIQMDQDSPPFDRAQLDGYAVRSADVASAGATLEVIGQADAGGVLFTGTIGPGKCVGINTGAPVPQGADAILMVEHSHRVVSAADVSGGAGRGAVQALRAVKPGTGIQKRGADAPAGATVLAAGVRLRAAELAVCAAAGVAEPLVRRARVAVLTTGDELVEPSVMPGPGKIRNSNHPMLCALVTGAGASLVDLGACGDDAGVLRTQVEEAFAQADLLVVSGGMSMGTRDLIPPLLEEVGVRLHIQKVRIKPGKPFLFGRLDRPGLPARYVAGLPGNPVSAFVTFHCLVKPLLAHLTGAPVQEAVPVRVAAALPANGDREFFMPCDLRQTPTGLEALPLNWKGSADLFTLAHARALLVRPLNTTPLAPGDQATALLLD